VAGLLVGAQGADQPELAGLETTGILRDWVCAFGER
jgi:hypothetical protein